MKLYHGTNLHISEVDLSKGSSHKDFGKGFYLTPEVETAKRMAIKRTRLNGGSPILLTFEFDENVYQDTSIKIKEFTPCEDWIEFVKLNRDKSNIGKQHDFDIVIGPIANDGVAYLLSRWEEGTMPLSMVLEQLRGRFLDTQYYFGTQKSLKFLKLLNTESL